MGTYKHSYTSTYNLLRGLRGLIISTAIVRVTSTLYLQVGLLGLGFRGLGLRGFGLEV